MNSQLGVVTLPAYRSPQSTIRATLCLSLALCASTVSRAELDVQSAAGLFGRLPAVWGARLSPDGEKFSFLRQHPDDFPVAMVVDLGLGKPNLFLASDPKKNMDLFGCEWANNDRLLCSYYGVHRTRGDFYTATRIVAVDADGKNAVVLAQRQQRKEAAYHQDHVISFLPADRESILLPVVEDYGQGVSRVDIYKNRLKVVERPRRSVWGYWADSNGDLRIRRDVDQEFSDLQYRVAGEKKWRRLKRVRPEDLHDHFQPIGFGDEADELFAWDAHEGKRSLFKLRLGEELDRALVYAHPKFDLSGFVRLGKTLRPIGVTYVTDRTEIRYFDAAIKRIDDRLRSSLPGKSLSFISESWDKRYYLVHASSDVDPGAFYRYDATSGELQVITQSRPSLDDVDLANVEAIEFPAEDGVAVPGYLTLPAKSESNPPPLIVLPHGGPRARDVWGFDWLTQFFRRAWLRGSPSELSRIRRLRQRLGRRRRLSRMEASRDRH